MTTDDVDPQGTLTQLRAFLAQAPLSVDSRLPPERARAERQLVVYGPAQNYQGPPYGGSHD